MPWFSWTAALSCPCWYQWEPSGLCLNPWGTASSSCTQLLFPPLCPSWLVLVPFPFGSSLLPFLFLTFSCLRFPYGSWIVLGVGGAARWPGGGQNGLGSAESNSPLPGLSLAWFCVFSALGHQQWLPMPSLWGLTLTVALPTFSTRGERQD